MLRDAVAGSDVSDTGSENFVDIVSFFGALVHSDFLFQNPLQGSCNDGSFFSVAVMSDDIAAAKKDDVFP